VENTLSAFQHAYDLGYRYFETDVHVTADRVPVVFHDALLSRVTDVAGAVCDHTLESLRQIRLGDGDTIPTVAELLKAFPDVAFNLDIKADEVAGPLAQAIARQGANDRVLVTSFSLKRLNDFRKVSPTPAPAFGAPSPIVARYIAHSILGYPLPNYPCAALQVPVRQGPVNVVTRRFVLSAHRAGKLVHVWTIDDALEMERLIDLGVDGIMTDKPEILKEVLTTRGLF
jgi:glycerophosphoryl diester phosphodiesterase